MIIWVEAASCANRCEGCRLRGQEPYEAFFSNAVLQDLASEWGSLGLLEDALLHLECPTVLARTITSPETTYLGTNGTGLVGPAAGGTLGQLRSYGYQGLYMAVHGSRETHDAVVGRPGAFDEVVAATRVCAGTGLHVHWQLFLNTQNLSQVDDLFRLAYELYGGCPQINIMPFRLHPRSAAYEPLRPTAIEVAQQVPAQFIDSRWPDGLAPLTEAAWCRRWEDDHAEADFRHPFEPKEWPPQVPSDLTCIAIARNGNVYLDPMCAPPLRLGQKEEGRQTLERRAGQLAAPSTSCLEGWTQNLRKEENSRLHPSGWSARYKSISRMIVAQKGSLPDEGSLDFCGHF